MADITIIRNGARISLANFPKLGSGSENIAVAVSASGAYDTYTTELYYGWYQGSSMQKMLAQYQNGLYYIPANALFNAGNVYLTLRLVSGGNKVSTNTIPITIEKSAVNNEYSILPATETWQNAVDNYINNSINLLNERLDNLEVGGRNIIYNSNEIIEEVQNEENQAILFYMTNYGTEALKNGGAKYITVSFYLSTTATSGTGRVQLGGEPWTDFGNNIDISKINGKTYIKRTILIPDTWADYTIGMIQLKLDFAGGTYTITNFKLELGNYPTDWTPAPEDTQQIITNKSFSVNLEQGKEVELSFSYSGDYVPNEISSVALSNTSISSGYVYSYITHLLTYNNGTKTCYLKVINGTNATINDTVNVGVRLIKIQN